MKVNCVSKKGGAVLLNKKHGVWASYAVAGVAGQEPSELFYAGAKLNDGRQVEFFLNRETGLIVVDVKSAKGNGGNEILRVHASQVPMPK